MKNELKRILKFSSIGFLCTTLHACIFTLVYEVIFANTLIANLIAFTIAFFASYLGHNLYTFRDKTQHARITHAHRLRFFLTTFSGLLLNIFWAYLFIDTLQWNIMYYNILGLYILTPLSAYLLHKLWVYRKIDTAYNYNNSV